MNRTSKQRMIIVALFAVLTTGCHKPTFETMEPSKLKWSLSVVAQATSNAQKAAVESQLSNFAMQHAISGHVEWVAPGGGVSALQKIVKQKQSDLVLWTADSGNLQNVAAQNEQMRFAVVGATDTPTGNNVRNITIDRKRLLFLAGFLAAEANRESVEPFSVLVDHQRAAADPDWQMILAGCKLAGRHDLPVQVLASSLAPEPRQTDRSTAGAADKTTSGKTQSPIAIHAQPLRLPGHAVLLLDSLTADAATKIKAQGMKVVRTDLSDQPNAVQDNVVAEPNSILEAALQEEVNLLATGKWAGKQVVALDPPQPYQVLLPGLFADKDISTQLEIVDDQLNSGALKPDALLAE